MDKGSSRSGEAGCYSSHTHAPLLLSHFLWSLCLHVASHQANVTASPQALPQSRLHPVWERPTVPVRPRDPLLPTRQVCVALGYCLCESLMSAAAETSAFNDRHPNGDSGAHNSCRWQDRGPEGLKGLKVGSQDSAPGLQVLCPPARSSAAPYP